MRKSLVLLTAFAACLCAQGGRGRGAVAPARAPEPGPANKQVVDKAAADRGKAVYIVECVTCHGAKARGSSEGAPPGLQGPDLVRSQIVLHDLLGSELGPFLRKGHTMQSGKSSTTLSQEQIVDLSHFLKQRLYDTLNRGPNNSGNPAPNIVTGDAKAGETYFNGAGKCSTCHSPAGDLGGIASKYDPVTVQQRFLFPGPARGGRGAPNPRSTVTWTVTLPDGKSYTGTAIHIDDFDVQIRDENGDYHAWKRTPAMKLVEHDPFAAHHEMLRHYTAKEIHDVVAYLETLK
jgi:mono/diheme cytochrome c family protein